MNQPQPFRAKVAEHYALNQKYHFLHLELIEPHLLEFQAGQYISLDIGGGERRAYSIASKPLNNHEVDICVDIMPGGKGTTFIKNLQPGDEIKFIGPLGRLAMGNESKLLFVATGCGIAPIKSMVFELLEDKKDQREIWLFWGLRFVEDMFWEEDWRQINKSYPNFHYRLILSKPPEHWPLAAGHVNEEIEALSLDESWGVYLCGNKEMVEEVKELVVKKGVPENQIHFEKF